jgi:hypothetical protein
MIITLINAYRAAIMMEELMISNAEMNKELRDLRSMKDDDVDDEGTTPRSLSSSTNDEAPKSKCLIHHSLNPGMTIEVIYFIRAL